MSSALDDLHDLPPGVDIPDATLPRCWPTIDSISTDGEKRGATEICLDWANGNCVRGIHCGARHALPSMADENRLYYSEDGLRDVFGRGRASLGTPTSAFDPLACQIIHVKSGVPAGTLQQRRAIIDEKPTRLSRALEFLYKEYLPEFFWWEIMEMFRRFVLVGILVMFRPGSLEQLVLGSSFCLVYLTVQLQIGPYRNRSDQFLAGCTSSLITLFFMCCILFKFAIDSKIVVQGRQQRVYSGVYGGNDDLAMKAAGHEFKSLLAIYNSHVPGLHFPLVALIDYLGFRIIASSLLPISAIFWPFWTDWSSFTSSVWLCA